MELKMFSFINEVTKTLKSLNEKLEIASDEIENYFEEILLLNNEGYLNINSRVKSEESLKEKVLRNSYYKKYKSSDELIDNLSDLIGVRIECRFIEDEDKVYKVLLKHFNEIHTDGYYYNSLNKNIRLELESKQPLEQKNGFEIYKIDGIYEYNNTTFNFELQIKSLVNIFWGEIEHKIIYKNNNYMVWDSFFKDMMGSIKKNLSMIDNQLLIIDNQFNKINAINLVDRKFQVETALSKIIYDIFSTKMKNSIGFIVDFKKSCDTIMKYIFRTNNAENMDDYNATLLKTFSRLNEIGKNNVDFNTEIKFERVIYLEDEFSRIISKEILNSINSDFKWNTFFRILFEIELGNNAEDFETFISFIRNRFYNNKSFSKLYVSFGEEKGNKIIDALMLNIANSFKSIDSINFIYDDSIEQMNEILDNFVDLICKKTKSYEEWEESKDIYLELFNLKKLSLFGVNIEINKVRELIEKVKDSDAKIKIGKGILDHIDKLDTIDKIKAEKVLTFFKI